MTLLGVLRRLFTAQLRKPGKASREQETMHDMGD